jgi:[acyl-carrier-protein] S-malonyltransferase
VRLAFLFPGQGARNLVAGLALARSWPEGRALVSLAAEAANLTDLELDANGGRALERTEVLQPVLVAIALSVHHALARAGIRPTLVLGHSLGEVAAFAAGGCLGDEAAVKLAAKRGALMAREAEKHPGGLLALPSSDAAHRALALAPALTLAALNAPDEVLIGGPDEALLLVTAQMPGRRVPVAGAWHTDAMKGAVAELREELTRIEAREAKVRVMGTVDGLPDALCKPVRFTETLAKAWSQGLDGFVTVGPGAVMRGLLRKNLSSSVKVFTTEDAHDFERTVSALRLA